jgi:protocatechuate 3,4-dioxygenase alpha subunit
MDGDGRVITPSQTVGPFFSFCLTRHPAHLSLLGGPRLATDAVPGTRIVIGGAIHDGLGAPVPDAMIEVWQADSQGRYAGASDASSGFRGFGRVECDAAGRFAIETIKPGPVRAPGGGVQAPHIALGIFAKGLNRRLYTRVYFGDERANDSDPVLLSVPAARRNTLIARAVADGRYEFVIRLQGGDETVFFEV